jgi:hypothetical protein
MMDTRSLTAIEKAELRLRLFGITTGLLTLHWKT